MAVATAIATTTTMVNNVWRYLQTDIFTGFNFMCEEIRWLKDQKGLGTPWSGRKLEMPLDLNEGGIVASIPQGGYKARPVSPNAELGTVDIQQFSAAFTMTELAKWADEGNKNQLAQQMKWQAKKTVQGVGRHVADYIHGGSSAVLATTDTDQTAGPDTFTLTAGYGNTAITNAAFIADKFRAGGSNNDGDWVGVINGSTLKAIGRVTSRSTTTPSITVDYTNGYRPGTDATNGLKIVKANSMGNGTASTLTDDTDFNKGLVGFQDVISGSVNPHGLSHANWTVAFSDTTTGGRLNGVRIRQMFDAIEDFGPPIAGKKILLTTKGVYRDMIDYERSALRQNDPLALEVDGDITVNGYTVRKSRRVPPGYCIVYDDDKYRKVMYKPVPEGAGTDGITPSDGIFYPDQSLIRYDLPVVLGLVVTSRKSFAYATGLAEQ